MKRIFYSMDILVQILNVIANSPINNKYKLYKIMKQNQPKRDSKGRFVKTKPSYEELEAVVKLQKDDIFYWKDKYEEEKQRFELCKEIGKKRGAAIEWLLERAPFWIRNKFIDTFGVL